MDLEGIYQICRLSKENEIWRLPGPFQTLSKSIGEKHTSGIVAVKLKKIKITVVQHTIMYTWNISRYSRNAERNAKPFYYTE